MKSFEANLPKSFAILESVLMGCTGLNLMRTCRMMAYDLAASVDVRLLFQNIGLALSVDLLGGEVGLQRLAGAVDRRDQAFGIAAGFEVAG